MILNPFINSTSSRALTLSILALAILLIAGAGNAQGQRRLPAAQPAAEEPPPVFSEYRGVQLGMTADEVRKKLGEPKNKGEEEDFYLFTDTEMAQFIYDKTRKLTAMSVDFMSTGGSIPTPKQVLGSEIESKADGSMYKLVRYPKAGYWLSYNRTAGASPLTTVTIQKIQ